MAFMQPIKSLAQWLSDNANEQHYLFTLHDLRALHPELSDTAFKTLLSRAVSANLLIRACRGIYLDQKKLPSDGLLLFHIAALLRANEFNYVSLETALSATGVISQIPINWISIMSSGRSNAIACGDFGTIEFIHTKQKPESLIDQLTYDHRCGMWRAMVALALRDMKTTHRDTDLINWDIVNESI